MAAVLAMEMSMNDGSVVSDAVVKGQLESKIIACIVWCA